MKKLLIGFGIALLLAFVLQFFTSWWALPVVAGLMALALRLPVWQGMVAGLLIGFIIWGSYALWLDGQNSGQLSAKIGTLFNGLGSNQLILTTGVIGGIAGLLGGFIGSAIAAIFRPTVFK
jgi:hypothetical protein